jgi:hypothetical protein
MGKKAPALHFNEVQPARGLEQSAGRNQIQGGQGIYPFNPRKRLAVRGQTRLFLV